MKTIKDIRITKDSIYCGELISTYTGLYSTVGGYYFKRTWFTNLLLKILNKVVDRKIQKLAKIKEKQKELVKDHFQKFKEEFYKDHNVITFGTIDEQKEYFRKFNN